MSLAILASLIVAPTLAALWGGSTLAVLWAASAPFLDLVGTDRFVWGGAVHLAIAALVVPFLVEVVRDIRARRTATRGSPPLTNPWWRSSWAWALGALGIVDFILVPAQQSFGLQVPRSVLAAGLLAGAVVVAWLLLRGAWWAGVGTVRGLWRAGVRSAMLTGALIASAVLLPALGYANLALLDHLAQSGARPIEANLLHACERPGMAHLCGTERPTTTTQAFESRATMPVEVPGGDDHRVMADCMETLHRTDEAQSYSYNGVIAHAERLLGNRADALDVVQQTLLAVCLRHERQRILDLHPYFVRSVSNRARRDRSRRWCAVPIEEDAPLWCTAPSPEEMAVQDERIRAVEQAFCELPTKESRMIEMRDFDDLDYREIAGRLSISEDSARQRHSRALRELVARFRQRCD